MVPEQRLVLAACRAAFTAAPLEECGSVDAAHAIALADALGVVGLVADQLRQRPGADRRWAAAWRANAARNAMLAAELAGWCDALAAGGVEAVAFKGVALARTTFG